jgi:hypothetical protein
VGQGVPDRPQCLTLRDAARHILVVVVAVAVAAKR